MTIVAEIVPSEQLTNPLSAKDARIVSLSDLRTQSKENPSDYVVAGLIPESSVNIAIGDSGLGKTPLAYQMGLAVATGVPFVGFPTKKGPVLYVDLENGRDQIVKLSESLQRHLGLPAFPDENFGVVQECDLPLLSSLVANARPSLVVIDTLRVFDPKAEKENDTAAELLRRLHILAKNYGTAFLILHHLRKPSKEGRPALESTPVMNWLLEGSGARALVNQTEVRIGIDLPEANEEVALVLRGHAKLQGEVGPIYLQRVVDEQGEVIGYRRASAVTLLSEAHQIQTYNTLPPIFTFKEARTVYQRADDPTNKFLKKCVGLGILEKSGGLYRKIHDPPE